MNQFFQSSRFIIVGASNEPHKFGYKVMTWYKQHKLPNIIPMNPKGGVIGGIESITSLDSLDFTQFTSTTSLSIITPPAITLKIVEQAIKLNILSIWIQPGAEDRSVLEFVEQQSDQVKQRIIFDCILVKGEAYLNQVRSNHLVSSSKGSL